MVERSDILRSVLLKNEGRREHGPWLCLSWIQRKQFKGYQDTGKMAVGRKQSRQQDKDGIRMDQFKEGTIEISHKNRSRRERGIRVGS